MIKKLLVPDIGDFEEVEVIEILVKTGDKIKLSDPVVTIEGDKSSVEVPSTMEGEVESINVKIGDKVSKGDLLISVSSLKETTSEKVVPKDTEKIINEAESVLKKEINLEIEASKTEFDKKTIKKEKQQNIQVANGNDIDPLETQEWLESLSSVLETDGSQRAQYLIKQLIEHSYKQGSDLVLSRNTP